MASLMDEAAIRRVAEISRLKLTEKEMEEFRAEFTDILSNFSRITEIEARGRELYYVREATAVFRKDVPEKRGDEAGRIRGQFSRKEDDYMLSPRSL